MFRENFFSLLISLAVLVINPLISLLLFCWTRVNECCPFWLLHIHFPCKLCHKPHNYSSDLPINSSNCGNTRQQDDCFPLDFVANEPPLLPCHSRGTSLSCSGQGAQEHGHSDALPLGAHQALAHWALPAAEECQDCLLPWRGEFGKPPSDGCPPAARMEEMWGWDHHGFTSATSPLCWSLEQWVLCPCHTGGWPRAQPSRKCGSFWCVCTGVKGAWKSFSALWHLSRERWVLQVPYAQAGNLWDKHN